MQKQPNKTIQCILFLFLIFTLIKSNRILGDDAKILVGVYQFPPLYSVSKNSKPVGLFVTILDNIAKKEGWTLEYVPCLFSQCLEKLERKEIDIVGAVPFSKEKEYKIDFSQNTVISTWSYIYSSTHDKYSSLLDLENKIIGIHGDSDAGNDLKSVVRQMGLQCEFIEFGSSSEILEALDNRWIDAGLIDRLYGLLYAWKYHVNNSPIILSPKGFRYASYKNRHDKLIETIDSCLNEMKNDPGSFYHGLIKNVTKERRRIDFLDRDTQIRIAILSLSMIIFIVLGVIILFPRKKGWRDSFTKTVKTIRTDGFKRRARTDFGCISSSAKNILSSAPIGIAMISDGKINWMSSHLMGVLGYSNDLLLGKELKTLFKDSRTYDLFSAKVNDPVFRYKLIKSETKWICSNRKIIDVHIRARLLDPENLSKGYLLAALDITEKKNLRKFCESQGRWQRLLTRLKVNFLPI